METECKYQGKGFPDDKTARECTERVLTGQVCIPNCPLKHIQITMEDKLGKDITPKISVEPHMLLWVVLATEKNQIEPLHTEAFKALQEYEAQSWLNRLGFVHGLFKDMKSYLQWDNLVTHSGGLGRAYKKKGAIKLSKPLP
jgi:hypothetical protein